MLIHIVPPAYSISYYVTSQTSFFEQIQEKIRNRGWPLIKFSYITLRHMSLLRILRMVLTVGRRQNWIAVLEISIKSFPLIPQNTRDITGLP